MTNELQEFKKFIGRVSLFCVIIGVILLAANFTYFGVLEEHDRQLVMERELQYRFSNQSISCVFIGDSHVVEAIDASAIDTNAFSFAYSSESYVEHYFKLRHLLENYDVSCVILQIDLHTFAKQNANAGVLGNIHYYGSMISDDELRELAGDDYKRVQLFVDQQLRVVGRGTNLLIYLLSGPPSEHVLSDSDFSEMNKVAIASMTVRSHFEGKPQINPLVYSYFQETVMLARAKNVTVLYMRYPISEEYLHAHKSQNGSLEHYYEQVLLGVPDYPMLDYQKLFFDNPAMFGDSDHVNGAGREALAEVIRADLLAEGVSD